MLAWRVGFSAYSFRTVTVFEALEKIAATGLHYAELFARQKLSPANPAARPTAGLSETLQKDLKNPCFGIEWERNTSEPLETHAKSAAFFEEIADRVAAS